MRIPGIVKSFYPGSFWDIKTNKKEVFLTFDDGPDPEVTPDVLNILKQFNAKATFFCVGENVMKYPSVFNLILKDGHAVGNHSYNHLKGWRSNTNEYIQNVDHAAELIKSNLFRPPYGRIKRSQYKILDKKYKIIFWDVLSFDYSKKVTGEDCVKNVIRNIRQGSIIVFHDAIKMKDNVIYALPNVLNYLKENEYSASKIEL